MLATGTPRRNPLRRRIHPCLPGISNSPLERECPESHEVQGNSSRVLLSAAVPKCKEGPWRSPLSADSNVAGTVESKFHNFVIAEEVTSEIVAGTATLGPD